MRNYSWRRRRERPQIAKAIATAAIVSLETRKTPAERKNEQRPVSFAKEKVDSACGGIIAPVGAASATVIASRRQRQASTAHPGARSRVA